MPPGEPLEHELADFVGAVSSGTAPRVDGLAGRRALALAQRVAIEMERGMDAFESGPAGFERRDRV